MSDAALGWAAAQVGSPVVDAEPLTGGVTSTMLALTHADGRRSVLRLITHEPWRTHGAELVTRESETQRLLRGTGVLTPQSLGLDATGAVTGHPTHLMTLVPGLVEVDRVHDRDLHELATVLVGIHAVRVDPMPRTYQPWAWEAKYVVPAWAADPAPWLRAFEILRSEAPSYVPTFLHRDFHPRNVLWDGDRISGVVDWVETSTGPAWLDVAHCSTNLAIDHGPDVAERFAAAYTGVTGVGRAPFWNLLDAVGFLPRPGTAGFTDDPDRLAGLDTWLTHLVRAG